MKTLRQFSKRQRVLLAGLALLLVLSAGTALVWISTGYGWRPSLPQGTAVSADPEQTNSIIPSQQGTPPALLPSLTPADTLPQGSPTSLPAEIMVGEQDSLVSIAARYGLLPEDLRRENFMYGDALLPGQRLLLPQQVPVPWAGYEFSSFQGDLSALYPLQTSTSRFSLHTRPGSFPSVDPNAVADLLLRGVNHIENLLQAPMSGSFDIYVAGSLFAHPDTHLRGISYSTSRRLFIIQDGTGSAADQQYFSTHEISHLIARNTLGKPASDLLNEGLAVYSGMSQVSGQGLLSLQVFCRAYLLMGELPQVSSSLSYSGHIYDLENYYAAGGFVGWLIETYGISSFSSVYPVGNYAAVYGKRLSDLEQDWRASLLNTTLPAGLDPGGLVDAVRALEQAYAGFIPDFEGSPEQIRAYYHLDQARLALLSGQLSTMQAQLDEYQAILDGQ